MLSLKSIDQELRDIYTLIACHLWYYAGTYMQLYASLYNVVQSNLDTIAHIPK